MPATSSVYVGLTQRWSGVGYITSRFPKLARYRLCVFVVTNVDFTLVYVRYIASCVC